MLTEKDKAAINAAKPGDVIALADGRRIVAERSTKISDCYGCEFANEDCHGMNCGSAEKVYRNERGI